MTEKYVIRSLYGDIGFWSEGYKSYKGFLYATQYHSFNVAVKEAENASQMAPCEIIKIYI